MQFKQSIATINSEDRLNKENGQQRRPYNQRETIVNDRFRWIEERMGNGEDHWIEEREWSMKKIIGSKRENGQ
jgi:hypothetical protein